LHVREQYRQNPRAFFANVRNLKAGNFEFEVSPLTLRAPSDYSYVGILTSCEKVFEIANPFSVKEKVSDA